MENKNLLEVGRVFEHDGERYRVGFISSDSVLTNSLVGNRAVTFGLHYINSYLERGLGRVLEPCDTVRVVYDYAERSTASDPIVESVVDRMRKRSDVGVRKYGTTMSENDKDDFLRHLHEELMDAVLYIEKLRSRSGGSCPLCATEKKN